MKCRWYRSSRPAVLSLPLPPGSPELAAAVVEALTAHDIVLMSNHGQVACGPYFPDTFRRAVFFEMACRIILLSHGNYTTV